MDRMKILVVDDTLVHREAATAQLGGEHDLLILCSYEDAKHQLLYSKESFDVLLTDLQMPARSDIARDKGQPETMQVMGDWLVKFAAMKKIPYIGLCTDVNHHADPASDAIAILSNWHYELTDNKDFTGPWQFMQINQSRVMYAEHDSMMGPVKNWKKVLENLVRGTSE